LTGKEPVYRILTWESWWDVGILLAAGLGLGVCGVFVLWIKNCCNERGKRVRCEAKLYFGFLAKIILGVKE
jgi:hypothetical protein